jgi:hypothetical protein
VKAGDAERLGKFHLGFQIRHISRSLPKKPGKRYDEYWTPINQIGWELRSLLRDSGFVLALPRKIRTVMLMLVYGDRYALSEQESGVNEMKWFVVSVHLDARRFPDEISDEERYWRESAIYLDALSFAAAHYDMPSPVRARLDAARARLASDAPWPPLPAFDLADVEKHYRENLERPARGRDGRLRKVRKMEREAGLLWVNCGPVAAPVDETIDRLQGDLRAFVADELAGEWDGDSRNGQVSDISFQVRNLAGDGRRIGAFLDNHWPALDYFISDEYAPQVFEDPP